MRQNGLFAAAVGVVLGLGAAVVAVEMVEVPGGNTR